MRKMFVAAAAAAALAMTGCVKEEVNEATGGPIRFAVSTTYDNGPATKTEYSGQDETGAAISSSSTYERIDWISGDEITIIANVRDSALSTASSAKYSVTTAMPDSGKGTAAIAPVDGNGLQWGSKELNFFAFYPSETPGDSVSFYLPPSYPIHIYGSIPESQKVTLDGRSFKPCMDYALMYAIARGCPGDFVTLSFKPLFTAAEFTLLADPDDPPASNLTSVALSTSRRIESAGPFFLPIM